MERRSKIGVISTRPSGKRSSGRMPNTPSASKTSMSCEGWRGSSRRSKTPIPHRLTALTARSCGLSAKRKAQTANRAGTTQLRSSNDSGKRGNSPPSTTCCPRGPPNTSGRILTASGRRHRGAAVPARIIVRAIRNTRSSTAAGTIGHDEMTAYVEYCPHRYGQCRAMSQGGTEGEIKA